jgi:hypothetical protein
MRSPEGSELVLGRLRACPRTKFRGNKKPGYSILFAGLPETESCGSGDGGDRGGNNRARRLSLARPMKFLLQ